MKPVALLLKMAVLAAAGLALAGCLSVPVQPKDVPVATPVPQISAAERFFEAGLAMLKAGEENRLLRAVSRDDDFPAERERLLTAWTQNQRHAFDKAIEAGNYFRAAFYLQSARAGNLPPEGISEMEFRLEPLAAALGYRKAIPSTVQGSAYSRVSEFNEILAHITVKRRWQTPEGIDRSSFPGSTGSGVQIADNLVLTNFHVVEHTQWPGTLSSTITVALGGKSTTATLLGWDHILDIAVLKLETPVPMKVAFSSVVGNSAQLKQGDTIHCIGNPLGLTTSMSQGIVSSTARSALEAGHWIQIDAALNPGDSGGMAVDRNLRIVGINVAGIGGTSINFIIPINDVMTRLDELVAGNPVAHPWLGLILREQSADTVVIADLFPGSVLRQYGVRRGETLVSINGVEIRSIKQAQELLMQSRAGNAARIVTMAGSNDTTKKTSLVFLPRRPERPVHSALTGLQRRATLFPFFGFEVEDTPANVLKLTVENRALELPLYRVKSVLPDDYLAAMGMKPDDYVGFLEDYYRNGSRVVEFLHLPKGIMFASIKDPDDYIFRLTKGEIDENIL